MKNVFKALKEQSKNFIDAGYKNIKEIKKVLNPFTILFLMTIALIMLDFFNLDKKLGQRFNTELISGIFTGIITLCAMWFIDDRQAKRTKQEVYMKEEAEFWIDYKRTFYQLKQAMETIVYTATGGETLLIKNDNMYKVLDDLALSLRKTHIENELYFEKQENLINGSEIRRIGFCMLKAFDDLKKIPNLYTFDNFYENHEGCTDEAHYNFSNEVKNYIKTNLKTWFFDYIICSKKKKYKEISNKDLCQFIEADLSKLMGQLNKITMAD